MKSGRIDRAFAMFVLDEMNPLLKISLTIFALRFHRYVMQAVGQKLLPFSRAQIAEPSATIPAMLSGVFLHQAFRSCVCRMAITDQLKLRSALFQTCYGSANGSGAKILSQLQQKLDERFQPSSWAVINPLNLETIQAKFLQWVDELTREALRTTPNPMEEQHEAALLMHLRAYSAYYLLSGLDSLVATVLEALKSWFKTNDDHQGYSEAIESYTAILAPGIELFVRQCAVACFLWGEDLECKEKELLATLNRESDGQGEQAAEILESVYVEILAEIANAVAENQEPAATVTECSILNEAESRLTARLKEAGLLETFDDG